MRPIIVGTAGHIDHGKSALVQALTGIDPDRLKEEKERGITIDLGFAHLDLDQNREEKLQLGFVDVPGHERFVRNMLAGAGGIDLVLMVISAEESIKPQTREHFDICRLLSVRHGITVLSKSDLVDLETLEVVELEVEEFLRGSFLDLVRSPLVRVSARTGVGLDDLKRALIQVASQIPARDSNAHARLPIDRVFSMKGFGTVVTGTLISGTIRREDDLEIFPSGQRVRVRGIQLHGQVADEAIAGQRTALNLAGADRQDLARGMILASPKRFHPSDHVDVLLSLLPSAKALKQRTKVHLHAYTLETIAEIHLYGQKQVDPGQNAYAELRLRDLALLLPQDRFIVRQFSPVLTIGGGVVLDQRFSANRKFSLSHVVSFLDIMAGGSPSEILAARVARRGKSGLTATDAVAETGWRRNQVLAQAHSLAEKHGLMQIGDLLLDAEVFNEIRRDAATQVDAFQQNNPLVAGIRKEALRERLATPDDVFAAVLDTLLAEKTLEVSGEFVHIAGRGVVLGSEESKSKETIEEAFASAGLRVPAVEEVLARVKLDKVRSRKIVTLLLHDRVLIKISDELVFHRKALEQLRAQLVAHKAKSPEIDLAAFKELAGISRKYAIPLLEYFDRERVTQRSGDRRIIL